MHKAIISRQVVTGISVLLVIGSLTVSITRQEPEIFGASGALMVIAGAILATRRLIRLGYEAYVLDKQIIDGGHFEPTPEEIEADRQFREDERAYQWSLPVLIIGTLIWAYGSLILTWLGFGP